MDPKLRELIAEGAAEEELEVILKLRAAMVVPTQVRVVARFGEIVTARVRRQDVRAVWEDPGLISIKAPRLVVAGD